MVYSSAINYDTGVMSPSSMGDPSHVDDTSAATDAPSAIISDAARHRRNEKEYLKEAPSLC